MQHTQHIWEINERDSQTPDKDWHVRRRFNPQTFPDVIQDSGLRRTFEAWQAGNDNDEALAAEIDVSSDNRYAYRILHHRNAEAMGLPAEGLELWKVDKHSPEWGRHAYWLAKEYSEAKRDGMTCYAISQSVDGKERRYHRIIKRRGEVLLVASAPFELVRYDIKEDDLDDG